MARRRLAPPQKQQSASAPWLAVGGAALLGGALLLLLWPRRAQGAEVSAPDASDGGGSAPPPPSGGEELREVLQVGGVSIYGNSREIVYTTKLSLDADGSPRAYHPADWGALHGRAPLGIDAPENAVGRREDMKAGSPDLVSKWAGVATTEPDGRGQPIVQGPDDPAPGYWVSTTAYAADPSRPESDPRRYFDPEVVPYISVPPELIEKLGVRKGDLALVSKGGATVWAVVADVGPRGRIGEASIATAAALGLSTNVRGGGGGDRAGGITTRIQLGSAAALGHPRTAEAIAQAGSQLGAVA